MYKPIIKTFYNHQQVLHRNIEESTSKSPLKPKLLLKYLQRKGLLRDNFQIQNFKPFCRDEFLIAHEIAYVDAFFEGISPLCNSNGIPWSDELVKSVCYTNASLYNALLSSYVHPDTVTFSPTSGFHHAHPERGGGFCSMSGQVIASVKLYRQFGVKTAWIDLDGHFGNSIEDSRDFVPDLNKAVPPEFNINPNGQHADYIASLVSHLEFLEKAILNNEIDGVVWCHGADSHIDDDLGGSCTTKEWIQCAEIFYSWVNRINAKRQCHLPVAMSLFGGYRSDDYTSVLSLHTADLVKCLNILCNHNIEYQPEVSTNSFRGYA